MSFDFASYRSRRRREGKDRPARYGEKVTTEAALRRAGRLPAQRDIPDPFDFANDQSDVSLGESDIHD